MTATPEPHSKPHIEYDFKALVTRLVMLGASLFSAGSMVYFQIIMQGSVNFNLPKLIVSLVLSAAFILGSLILFVGKKSGFVMLCATAIVLAVFNAFSNSPLLSMLFMLSPLYSWLLLRSIPAWRAKVFPPLSPDAQPPQQVQPAQPAQPDRLPLPQSEWPAPTAQSSQPAQPPQQVQPPARLPETQLPTVPQTTSLQASAYSPSFSQRAQNLMIWSGINAFLMPVALLPFLALYFAYLAKRSQTETHFRFWQRLSTALNIISYPIFAAIMIFVLVTS